METLSRLFIFVSKINEKRYKYQGYRIKFLLVLTLTMCHPPHIPGQLMVWLPCTMGVAAFLYALVVGRLDP